MPRVYIFVIYIFIPLKRCQPNVFNRSSSNWKSCVRTGFTNSHSTGSTSVRNRYATAQVGVAYFKWPGYIQSNMANGSTGAAGWTGWANGLPDKASPDSSWTAVMLTICTISPCCSGVFSGASSLSNKEVTAAVGTVGIKFKSLRALFV